MIRLIGKLSLKDTLVKGVCQVAQLQNTNSWKTKGERYRKSQAGVEVLILIVSACDLVTGISHLASTSINCSARDSETI
jgi:hypothetical protein